jgi:antitoxin MazE
MVTKLQKWGNSIAVRIPRGLARDLGVQEGTAVDLKVENGKLLVAPVARAAYSLDELLAGITAANRHGQWDTGDPLGAEAW